MGSVRARETSSGKIRFRAEIRINRNGFPAFIESKTFGTRRIAENWIEKREREIEKNPEILMGNAHASDIKLNVASDKYIEEVGGVYSKSKNYG